MSSGKWLPFCLGLNVLNMSTMQLDKSVYSVGYSFTDYPRQTGRVGGGTNILCWSNLTPSLVRSGENKSFKFSARSGTVKRVPFD